MYITRLFIFALSISTILCGCIMTRIEAPTVRPWEGRYESGDAAVSAARTIRLESGESVWLLSNSTLKRLLKSTKD